MCSAKRQGIHAEDEVKIDVDQFVAVELKSTPIERARDDGVTTTIIVNSFQ